MELWPHQKKALDEIANTRTNKVCITCPTGGGKTTIAIELIKRRQLRSVFYTHRKMLLSQTSRVFKKIGLNHGLMASGYDRNYQYDTQLAMVQTERNHFEKTDQLFESDFVIIDEAHNNSGPSMMEMIDYHENFHGSQIIGLTATPLGIGHAYDQLIVAGTNSELRECGALVPAYTYAPSEPDSSIVGKIKIGEAECAITGERRRIFAHKIFGDVIEHYRRLNPKQKPTVLFAPGVEESRWFCERLNDEGIKAAHIDGGTCVIDGEEYQTCQEIRDEIERRTRDGEIKVVCNRFVLREGIDWPFIEHGIMATVFGSLTSYLQAGGRIIRASDGFDHVTIQDHGGNWWRHGSLNADRNWQLGSTNRIEYEKRADSIREKKKPEPIVCPNCSSVRLRGSKCVTCGYFATGGQRRVITASGTLKMQSIGEFRQKRYQTKTERNMSEWRGRVLGVKRSRKPNVRMTTFAQLSARIALDNNYQYPGRDWPLMPKNQADFFRRICDVPMEKLIGN